jgi:hypothetical protein
MNVQEFIRESLVQIANAIHEANEVFASSSISAQANPAGAILESASGSTYLDVTDTQDIEFDIAVTVTESAEASSSKKAGVAISVVTGSVGGTKTSESSNSSVSRLKFTIPLKLPRPQKPMH